MSVALKTETEIAGRQSAEIRDCRVCGSPKITKVGTVEYYSGFAWPVFDCADCHSRFTKHDETIYDAMYEDSGSVYHVYGSLLEQTTRAFEDGDVESLRKFLSQGSKYRFVIDQVEQNTHARRLLEIGCSRGHLTSYFILAGYAVTGVDVSPAAIQSARQAFGNHFVLEGDPAIEAGAPYDVIYHVGTIGCVADPLGLTRRLLSLLKPGGALLFNSPNRESCWLSDQLWVDGAPPPDLVSIFPPGFWARQFSAEANVEEEIESCGSDTALKIGLGKLFGRRWKAPVPVPLNQTSDHYQNGNRPGRPDDSSWRAFENLILRVGRRTGLSRLAPSKPAEFGVFVKMVRK